MSPDNVLLAEGLYRDFAAGDMEALRKLAPNLTWHVASSFPYAGTYTGFDAIQAGVFNRIPEDWDGFVHELYEFLESGDDVMVTGFYYGKWKRTGRAIEAPFVHHLRFEAGELVHFRQYVDDRRMIAATDGFVHDPLN